MVKTDMEVQVNGTDSKKLVKKIKENIKKRRKDRKIIDFESLANWDELVSTPHGRLTYTLLKSKELIQRGIKKYFEPIFLNSSEFSMLPYDSKKKHSGNLQVHQMHPTVFLADAIGNDIIEICNILRSYGYNSDIYTKYSDPRLSRLVKNYQEYKKISSPNNILIIHYSGGYGDELFSFIKSLPDKKIVMYHSVAPPSYFVGYNDRMVAVLKKGVEQIKKFKDIVDEAWAVSEYARKELEKSGFSRTAVLPIILNFNKFKKFNRNIYEKFNDGKTNILFVGRIIPFKKIEDVILVFYYYNTYINKNSRLILVGSTSGLETYYKKLISLVKNLGINGKVLFTGKVSDEDLSAYYRVATDFLCMSDWESFCVPLVESMLFKIPVIAYNSTAVPYTMGNAGVLVNKKNYEEIAELINVINTDESLRSKIIKGQNKRLREFAPEKTERKLIGLLGTLSSLS